MPVGTLQRLLVTCLWVGVGVAAAADGGRPSPTTRQELIGAWRLLSIEVNGPAGRAMDPFYGSGTQGLLIYDLSGWFSVQFMGAARPALDVPASRPEPLPDGRAGLKAAALDSYYAYYGTWEFDPATSTVIHHAKGALYPGETRATYRQRVDVVGSRMTFTRSQGAADHPTTQTKAWERVLRP